MAADLRLLACVLATRIRVQRRDHWEREQVIAFQRRALKRLRAHASARSSYYREALRGLQDAPLGELPVLTKATLMRQWDRICTEPALCLADVETRLEQSEQTTGDPGHAWRGRWWLAATGGTTGRRAAFAWDRREWSQLLTSYVRVNDWAGVQVGLRHPVRTAVVGSLNPTHQSAMVGATLRSRLVPALRLDAGTPLPELVSALNEFRPRLLVAYASMVGPLALARLDGTLRITPQKVIAASEVLPATARAAAEQAWGTGVVVDSYAATETASIASTCPVGGFHLYEDFVLVEPVDDAFQPVPVGEAGTRLLVTPLFSRTLPLIRYELTDSVRLATRTCGCGLPFALLEAVEGRTEDTLLLTGTTGPVRVHPNVFHAALESLAPGGWQVEQLPDRLLVRLAGATSRPDLARDRLVAALTRLGALDPTVQVLVVPAIERTRLGKSPLVKALPRRT